MADVWFAKDVKPDTADSTKAVSLNDVLAAPSDNLLVNSAEHSSVATPKPGELHHALLERKLIEDEENNRLSGGPLL
jgi:hypothetical protein